MFPRAISSGNAAGGYFSGRPEPASMTLLLYGAYGYTGELIAREAVDRDMDVIVAGRNGTKTRGVGIQLGILGGEHPRLGAELDPDAAGLGPVASGDDHVQIAIHCLAGDQLARVAVGPVEQEGHIPRFGAPAKIPAGRVRD